jgi:alkanesulfonate monooxygenase SsuD/methylene tetrahydromethanopterin reductase-like flavin-dependent oxidoreductase (luciferase family)
MIEPRFGMFLGPDAQDAELTIDRAVTAERLGLDLIGIQDHPYQRRFLDTLSLLAFIAARTERISLAPDVANLPLRPPAVLAKAAATIDILSSGARRHPRAAGGAAGNPPQTRSRPSLTTVPR